VLVEAGVTVYTGAMTTTSGAPGSQYTGLVSFRSDGCAIEPSGGVRIGQDSSLCLTSSSSDDPITSAHQTHGILL
jgi:hypothetical protein